MNTYKNSNRNKKYFQAPLHPTPLPPTPLTSPQPSNPNSNNSPPAVTQRKLNLYSLILWARSSNSKIKISVIDTHQSAVIIIIRRAVAIRRDHTCRLCRVCSRVLRCIKGRHSNKYRKVLGIGSCRKDLRPRMWRVLWRNPIGRVMCSWVPCCRPLSYRVRKGLQGMIPVYHQ